MSFYVKGEKRTYAPAPEGLHSAVCCDFEDLGVVTDQWGSRPMIKLYWQIEETNPDNQNKPFVVSKRYNVSNPLYEKANLRKDIEGWRGKKFTAKEIDDLLSGNGFDVESLIGCNCQVQIQHNIAGEGEVYANVTAVVPSAKNGTKLRVSQDYVRRRDREERKAIESGERSGNGYHAADSDVPF